MQRRSADNLPLSDWCWPASAGLGNCLGVDPVLVPLIIVALVCPALALLAHIITWIVIAAASADEPESAAPHKDPCLRRGSGGADRSRDLLVVRSDDAMAQPWLLAPLMR